MDDADLAQVREEALITAALSARSPRAKSPDGMCLWCKDESAVFNTAFCSAECDQDFHKHQREMKQRLSDRL